MSWGAARLIDVPTVLLAVVSAIILLPMESELRVAVLGGAAIGFYSRYV